MSAHRQHLGNPLKCGLLGAVQGSGFSSPGEGLNLRLPRVSHRQLGGAR